MQQIVIDKELLAKLHDLREPLELLDEHGRRLGIVHPDPSRNRELLRTMEIPVSEQELQRREAEIGRVKGYSTAEVIASLHGTSNS